MKFRANWNTRFGFYFAAIGSAFGLGNLWRFPYIVGENGGGAFVLLYFFLAFFIGVPILIAELILGKSTQQSIIGAIKATLGTGRGAGRETRFKNVWLGLGKLAVATSLFVLGYYAVISGWVLHFFMQFLVSLFDSQGFQSNQALATLRQSGGLQVALASVHILLAIVIVMKGVQNGIEKWVGYLMSGFAVLLIMLVAKSLSLPQAGEALRFLLYPDFSKLTINSLGQALGHVFFTLSIGFGVMVTFGSYMRHDSYVPEAGLRVAAMDTSISLLSGLLIFPILISASVATGGPDVLFQTLPRLFEATAGGALFGTAFFLCLYLSALGASIGLLEVIVSNLGDRWGVSRSKACWAVGFLAFSIAILPALSSSALSQLHLGGRGVLQALDAFLINWILPLVALGLCLFVSGQVPPQTKEKEFHLSRKFDYVELFGNWRMVVRWVGPAVIVVALGLQLIGLFLKN